MPWQQYYIDSYTTRNRRWSQQLINYTTNSNVIKLKLESPHKVQLHQNGPSFAGGVATLYNYTATSKHLIS